MLIKISFINSSNWQIFSQDNMELWPELESSISKGKKEIILRSEQELNRLNLPGKQFVDI